MSANGLPSPHLHLLCPTFRTALVSRSNDAMGSRGGLFFIARHPRTSTRTSTLRPNPAFPTPSNLLAIDSASRVRRQSSFCQISIALNRPQSAETFEPQPNDRRPHWLAVNRASQFLFCLQ